MYPSPYSGIFAAIAAVISFFQKVGAESVIALGSAWLGAYWQRVHADRKEDEREAKANIINLNKKRTITDKIIWDLRPGNSVELMRHLLGAPTKVGSTDLSVLSGEEVVTNSYLYVFANAFVKLTSKDNFSLDSITVLPFFTFSIEALLREDYATYNLNEMVVTENLLDNMSEHKLLSTRYENVFAILTYDAYPTYHYHTFFGDINSAVEYRERADPQLFLGNTITAICVSYSSQESFYIYESEIR